MYQPNLPAVFNHIVMPGERSLQRMEDVGVYVDVQRLDEVTKRYEGEVARLERELVKAVPKTVDWDVNWNSPKQVADVLFKHCGLKSITKTASGADSTGKGVLLRLVDRHPIPRILLDLRRYNKAINGFLTPWKQYLSYELSKGRPPRLHTTYNIARTSTGRLSAEDPNLQQVARDKEIRSLICAPEGHVIIEADYSQIELRIAAFIARAHSMLNIYRAGGDIHSTTGAALANVDQSILTKAQRTSAKAVNFG